MCFLKDIWPITKKNTITLVSRTKDIGDIHTLNFKFREGLTWTPGQHGLLFVQHVKISKPSRMFSIASIPQEGVIKVSMRIPSEPSEFKQAMGSLELGETLVMRGPVGSFYLKDRKPTLLVAGGIGITPMRALLKDYITKKESYPIQLLYSDSREQFLYRDELDDLSAQGDISIKYLVEREELYAALNAYVTKQANDSSYFISGPKPMVMSLKDLLTQKGIRKKNIKHDPFIGY